MLLLPQVKELGRNKYQYFTNLRDEGFLDVYGKGCYVISEKGKSFAESQGWLA